MRLGGQRLFTTVFFSSSENKIYTKNVTLEIVLELTDISPKRRLRKRLHLKGKSAQMLALVNQMKLMFPESGSSECNCEARVRAFMSMLRVGEGTEDDKGYERIVGGSHFSDHGKDFSDHPKIPIYIASIDDDSYAAGAYQITLRNWNDSNFVNWRKKYGLTDFSPKTQDKYCYYLLANKKKAIDLIKKGYITEAIHKVRKEWASLPASGHGQREEKLADIINKYLEFYKGELKGESKLHLETGGFDKLGFNCDCNETSTTDNSCGQEHYDVSDMMVFYDQGTGNTDCNTTCKAIMRQIGVYAEGATEANRHSYYQLATENTARNGFDFDENDSKEGIAYLDMALKNGHPVLVGVDHTFKYRKHGKINEDTTDHYVIIVGRSCLNGKTIYKFWDVGTKWGGKGDYYFTLDGTKLTSSSREGKNYTVTQIRRNLKGKRYVQYK